MRNLNVKLILLTVLLSMVGTKVSAADIAVQNGDGVTIYYNFINNGAELEVTEMPNSEKYAGDIVIPEVVEIDGKVYHVTAIAHSGFMDCNDITSIKMPSGIKDFGKSYRTPCSILTQLESEPVIALGTKTVILPLVPKLRIVT